MARALTFEPVTKVAPLGVRFRDAATSEFVGGGLIVEAYRESRPERRIPAVVNSRGIFTFHDLPGLREAESGRGDEAYWTPGPEPVPFIIEGRDELGRFLPFRFAADIPARGQFAPPCLDPGAGGVPLYSAPTRRMPAGMAILRAQFEEAATGLPAAWTVVEARHGGNTARGVSDRQGRLMLPFGYPEPVMFNLGSPGGALGPPLEEQTWEIEIRAWYEPEDDPPEMPDLCALEDLARRAPSPVWEDTAMSRLLDRLTLRFGQELLARTRNTVTGRDLPVVLISPAGSPP
jgi:hypothetical protein